MASAVSCTVLPLPTLFEHVHALEAGALAGRLPPVGMPTRYARVSARDAASAVVDFVTVSAATVPSSSSRWKHLQANAKKMERPSNNPRLVRELPCHIAELSVKMATKNHMREVLRLRRLSDLVSQHVEKACALLRLRDGVGLSAEQADDLLEVMGELLAITEHAEGLCPSRWKTGLLTTLNAFEASLGASVHGDSVV